MNNTKFDECLDCPVRLYVNNGDCPLSLCLKQAFTNMNYHLDVLTIILWEKGWTIEEIAEHKGTSRNNTLVRIINWRKKKRLAGLLV